MARRSSFASSSNARAFASGRRQHQVRGPVRAQAAKLHLASGRMGRGHEQGEMFAARYDSAASSRAGTQDAADDRKWSPVERRYADREPHRDARRCARRRELSAAQAHPRRLRGGVDPRAERERVDRRGRRRQRRFQWLLWLRGLTRLGPGLGDVHTERRFSPGAACGRRRARDRERPPSSSEATASGGTSSPASCPGIHLDDLLPVLGCTLPGRPTRESVTPS